MVPPVADPLQSDQGTGHDVKQREHRGENDGCRSAPIAVHRRGSRVLGIGRTRMFELIQAGSVETVLIGRLRRIPFDALDAFVTGLRESPQGAPRRSSDSQG
jgi:excisionase family DNA binding protein